MFAQKCAFFSLTALKVWSKIKLHRSPCMQHIILTREDNLLVEQSKVTTKEQTLLFFNKLFSLSRSHLR